MGRANVSDRLQRLELLAAQLKQDALCTVSGLAQQFGVSERTITRDLALMREQGLPIDADRGRGGGVRLDRNWGVGRLNLAYPDAVDLLVSIEVAERMESPLFLAGLGAVKRQLIASFSPDRREKVERLKSRILIGDTASAYVQLGVSAPAGPVVQALHQAFVEQERLEIAYRREDGATSQRLVEPHYLLLQYPVWYVIAFDYLRKTARVFRCDRITEASRTDEAFSLLPRTVFENVLEGSALRL